jgi:excisionase family DNA binding protein
MTQLPKAEKLGYSVAEACAALSLGKTSLYAHIAAGRLRKVRLGGRTIIPTDSLKAIFDGSLPNADASRLPGAAE